MTAKVIAKAIHRFEPSGPSKRQRDFPGVKDLVPIPLFTRVDVFKTEKGSDGIIRDHFTLLDFDHAGQKAYLSHTAAGSKLVDPPKYHGPCLVDWDVKRGTVEVSVPSDPSIAKVTATATSQPHVPDGSYKLRPWLSLRKNEGKVQFGCEKYLGTDDHACHWWKIQYSDLSFCLHCGAQSLGCISVNQAGGWEPIYHILAFCRTADGAFTGDIRIKGHSPLTS
jgi:hypothetical protein